jgi:hypothetical protein
MFWHKIAATNLLQSISNVESVSFVLPHTGLRNIRCWLKTKQWLWNEAMYPTAKKDLSFLADII